MSTVKTYLISLETLKSDYPIDANLDDQYIKPNIIKCQDLIIRPLLGEVLWAQVIKEIKDGTITELHQELIKEYLQPIIAYYVMSEVIYNTAYKLKNQGTQDSDNDSRFDELVRLSKKYLIDSDAYQSRLKQWMQLYTPITVDCRYRYKNSIYLGTGTGINYDELPNKPR